MEGDNIYSVEGFLVINLSVSRGGRCGGVKHLAQPQLLRPSVPPLCLRQDEISEPEKYPAGTKRQEGEGGKGGDTYTYKGDEN